MLTNITPGFYKAKNKELACVAKVINGQAIGYFNIANRFENPPNTYLLEQHWEASNGRFFELRESPYDLMERVEC